jgi:hypothetical protein
MPHFPKPAAGSWTQHYPDPGTGPISFEDSTTVNGQVAAYQNSAQESSVAAR